MQTQNTCIRTKFRRYSSVDNTWHGLSALKYLLLSNKNCGAVEHWLAHLESNHRLVFSQEQWAQLDKAERGCSKSDSDTTPCICNMITSSVFSFLKKKKTPHSLHHNTGWGPAGCARLSQQYYRSTCQMFLSQLIVRIYVGHFFLSNWNNPSACQQLNSGEGLVFAESKQWCCEEFPSDALQQKSMATINIDTFQLGI